LREISDSALSRKKLAAMQNKPKRNVTTTESDQSGRHFRQPAELLWAVTMAHTAASGFTIICREVPKMAYAISGRMRE
jgi:hypothetical protein